MTAQSRVSVGPLAIVGATLILLVVWVFSTTAHVNTVHRSTSPTSAMTESPAQLLRVVAQNASQAGWVHVNYQLSGRGSTTVYRDVAGPQSGSQDITSNGSHARTEVFGNVAYVKADATMLAGLLGVPTSTADRIANRWVAFPSSDARYATISRGLTLASVLEEVLPGPPLAQAGSSPFDGVQQVVVTGSSPVSFGPGTSTLLVTTGSHALPISLAAGQGSVSKLQLDFSQWGTPMRLTAPTGAIPAASIGL